MQRPIRVVLAVPAPSAGAASDAGVARRLRGAGMEVIETGAHEAAEDIAGAAVREDADVVALPPLAEDRAELVPRLLELLHAGGARDVVVLVVGPGRDASREAASPEAA